MHYKILHCIKSHNLGALIKKRKYADKDNDDVYIFDSQELEDAIFMEDVTFMCCS